LVEKNQRFRSVLVRNHHFEEVKVDITNHFHEVELEDGEEDEKGLLEKTISNLSSNLISLEFPLWQIYLIKNYSKGTILFWRIHHVLI
jgi:hypothetical protein